MDSQLLFGEYTIRQVTRKRHGYGDDAIEVGYEVQASVRVAEVEWNVKFDVPAGMRVPQVGDRMSVDVQALSGSYMTPIPWPFNKDGSRKYNAALLDEEDQ